jgi:glutathione S-transferase
MKLYYSPISPYSHKALIALDEKGAKYESEIVNLGDPAARAEFEKINRFGKVPFLADDARDWRVPESSIIIEYLDRHVDGGTQLLPADPDLARQARFHDRIMDLYVTEQALKIFFDSRRPEGKHDPVGVESAEKRLEKTCQMYNDYMAKRQWLLGDAFSMADIAAATALATTHRLRPTLIDGLPNLKAYFERLLRRPSVERVFARVAAERAAR